MQRDIVEFYSSRQGQFIYWDFAPRKSHLLPLVLGRVELVVKDLGPVIEGSDMEIAVKGEKCGTYAVVEVIQMHLLAETYCDLRGMNECVNLLRDTVWTRRRLVCIITVRVLFLNARVVMLIVLECLLMSVDLRVALLEEWAKVRARQ